ncbi:MAG: 2-C-methyl-D-erythritol 4-phosphate cytidylyltransferase [Planctomycetes bacterium]|nr:2-C-methyl-D-erythritol 4-phosphate cytidylyltransferase [Planctomycetota bacterium]
MDRPDVGVILVAAGSGQRFAEAGGRGAKVFASLLGKPLYRHALDRFLSFPEVIEIVLVADPRAVGDLAAGISGIAPGRCRVVAGGARRQDSVANGLRALGPDARWIAIHDAARPAIHELDIRETLRRARAVGAAILARPSTDTLKEVGGDGAIARTLPRDRIWRAETPQIARRDLLERGFASWPDGVEATDDAILLERAGVAVAVAAARFGNPKVTVPEDLLAAEAVVARRGGRDADGRDVRPSEGP